MGAHYLRLGDEFWAKLTISCFNNCQQTLTKAPKPMMKGVNCPTESIVLILVTLFRARVISIAVIETTVLASARMIHLMRYNLQTSQL